MVRPARVLVAVLVMCLAAGSCIYQSFAFQVPTQVTVGSVFAIEVEAQFSGLQGMPPAAVFQVPDGFELVGAAAVARGTPTTIVFPDAGGASPPMNFSWIPAWGPNVEPGHHMVWFSAYSGSLLGVPSTGRLKVYLRAPAVAGVHVLKLALGHRSIDSKFGFPYGHALPAGNNGFATMTAPAHVRPIQVVASVPPPPFALAVPPWVEGTALPGQVVLADIDADGRDDVVERYAQQATVQLSRPNGWLTAATLPLATGSGPVRVADCDGDAFGDLVLASGAVWFGDGGGSWTPGPVLPHGFAAPDVAIGDVDGDARADVAFADATGCTVFKANANRSFTPFGSGLPASTVPSAGRVLVVDLEGDDRAEILLWSVSGAPVQLWHGDGAGNWALAGNLAFAGAPPHALDDEPFVALDVDGDGRKEIVRAGSSIGYAYTGIGVVPLVAPVLAFDRAVAMDLDRDGRTDLVTASTVAAGAAITWWRHAAGGSFVATTLPRELGFVPLDRVAGLCAGDIDGDTFPDLAASFVGERTLVWRNTVTGLATYGQGCAGTGMPAPAIAATGPVVPGQSLTVQVSGALANGPGLLWAGLSRRTWAGLPLLPMDLTFFGAPGCELLAEPVVIVPLTADANGVMAKLVPLPPLLPIDALTFFLQGAVLAPGANPLQFLFSDGLALKMQ